MTTKEWVHGLLIAAAVCLAGSADRAAADHLHQRRYQRHHSWNFNYYDPAWGYTPHSLVVPPTACRHVEYNWGVSGTQNLPIHHQYVPGMRNLPGTGGGWLSPAPIQPSSTNQMGVYYIRAPH